MAVGIDNMFMLVGDFDAIVARMDEADRPDIEKRLRAMLKHMGLSVILTSLGGMFNQSKRLILEDTFAFLIGSNTAMPVVRWFCYQATICLFLLLMLQISMFCAVIVLDAK